MTSESIRQARLGVDILVHMLKKSEILRMKDDDPVLLGRAVAQHYGIRTSLLDVTLDPGVAVFFASMGGSGDAGAVFVFDWEHCEALAVPIILPPVSPWSRRLTIQRGFFMEFEHIERLDVQDVPFEVRFPRMPGFEVRRAGETYVPWPVDEPAASELIEWVRRSAANHQVVSPSITAQIEARGETRSLLKYQFELMFGFAPTSQPEDRERVREAIWRYMTDSFEQLEIYINHLCLQRGSLAHDRVSHLIACNRSMFGLYANQLNRGLQACHSPEPQYAEMLRILKSEGLLH
jgi:hypothetical protein